MLRGRELHVMVAVEADDRFDVVLDRLVEPLEQFFNGLVDRAHKNVFGTCDRHLLVRCAHELVDRFAQLGFKIGRKAFRNGDALEESVELAGGPDVDGRQAEEQWKHLLRSDASL